MKRFISVALLTLAAILTGCDKKAATDFLPQRQITTFTVATAPQTRAAGANLSRYIMEIYEGTSAAGDPIAHIEQDNGIFDVQLNQDQDYTALFWADGGTADTQDTDGGYNAADLKKVTINGRASDAGYAGVTRFNMAVDNPDDYTNVTLSHAVAKISYVQSEAFPESDNTLTVAFPRSYTLNTDGMTVAEIKNGDASVPVTHTFAGITAGTAGTTFAESYVFASAGDKTLVDITLTCNDEQPKEVTNIPIRCNYNTNLKGSYSDSGNLTFSVSYEENWNTPDYEKPLQINIRKVSNDGGNGAPLYEIHTARGLKAFADLVNGGGFYEIDGIEIPVIATETHRKSNAILAKDIDLSEVCGAEIGNWKPIGERTGYPFIGTFDGNGKTISNLYINDKIDRTSASEIVPHIYGLFKEAYINSVIKNLSVTGSITLDVKSLSDNICVGGVAGAAPTITNCHSSVDITARLDNQDVKSGGIQAGGIVGRVITRSGFGFPYSGKITDCTSSSHIIAEYYAPADGFGLNSCVGGIVGIVQEADIIGCHSVGGSVKAYCNNYRMYVGGIVGSTNAFNLSLCVVFGCSNSSPVTVKLQKKDDKDQIAYIGGISGICEKSTVAICYNTADITILSGTASYRAGGIVGCFSTNDIYACYSTGNVIDQTVGVTISHKGGLIGAMSNFSASYLASQCWYKGNTDLGTNGIGAFLIWGEDPSSDDATANTDGGRVTDPTALNDKVAGMNAAVKTYNEGAKAGKECLYHFVTGATTPVIAPGAPD